MTWACDQSDRGTPDHLICVRSRQRLLWWGLRPVRHDWDLIVYEMHVKGFTRHPSSGVAGNTPGTFLGVAEKVPICGSWVLPPSS